ncbi:MAG: M48 family metalloprotease [SAR324 cluster bacterium]|nr:M48 family metalloprotease [SAR324 cluster bacterium]
MKNLFSFLFVMWFIPSLGLVTSIWIITDLGSRFLMEGFSTIEAICTNEHISNLSGAQIVCSEFFSVRRLKFLSLVTGIIGVIPLFLLWIAALVSGQDRTRVSNYFPFAVRAMWVCLIAAVFFQGLVLTLSIWNIGSHFASHDEFFAIGLVSFFVIVSYLSFLSAVYSLGRKPILTLVGTEITKEKGAELFALVEEVARSVNAKTPKRIILGLEPKCFVTNTDIHIAGLEGAAYTGETLYLSGTLLRLLSITELKAIVGHELGHFSGKDVVYSEEFSPVYSGLLSSWALVKKDLEGKVYLPMLPAVIMLKNILSIFADNILAISKIREAEADSLSAQVSGPINFATALIKIQIFSKTWEAVSGKNTSRLSAGKISKNLGKLFQDSVRYDLGPKNVNKEVHSVLKSRISHPSDTHSTILERITTLGVDLTKIYWKKAMLESGNSLSLISGLEEIEEELTVLEHKYTIASGVASLPEKEEEKTDYLLNGLYNLAAAMVRADERIEDEEIIVAEEIGREIFPTFDSTDFREVINDTESLSDPAEICKIMNGMLDRKGKRMMLKYLEAVAKADSEFHEKEKELMELVKTIFAT